MLQALSTKNYLGLFYFVRRANISAVLWKTDDNSLVKKTGSLNELQSTLSSKIFGRFNFQTKAGPKIKLSEIFGV